MKKIILSLLSILIVGSAAAQTGKLRVAVAFNTDTRFTLLGPLSVNSLDIDLTGTLYKQVEMLVDTASFSLKRVYLPEDISSANNPSMTGIPTKSQLSGWFKSLRKKEEFDVLLMIYKPLQMTGTYAALEGLSYGLNTSKGYVFTLNNALVMNMGSMEVLAATKIESENDYLAGQVEVIKDLRKDDSRNIETPIEMINKLNQDFALKVFQCLQVTKKKLAQK